MNTWNKFLSSLCDYWGIVLRELALYIELHFYVKRKLNFIRYTLPFEKGIGKSYTLLKLAIKHDIPIVVKTQDDKEKLLENQRKYMNLKGVPNILVYDQIENRYDIILIDEGLTGSDVHKLKVLCNIIIGYVLISNKKVEEN